MSFGSGLDDSNEDSMSEINMTPLVDVMLVLLIIFIITMPVITHSVNIDLPQANNTPSKIEPETIKLTVDKNSDILWDDQVISFSELEQRFAQVAQAEPQPVIHLHGDKAVAYEHVVKVMAAAQLNGVTKLGFVTEPAK